MRRAFWIAVGLGAGVAAAVIASRWVRRQGQRIAQAPGEIGTQAAEGARDLGKLLREALEEGRREMERTEAEIRSKLPA